MKLVLKNSKLIFEKKSGTETVTLTPFESFQGSMSSSGKIQTSSQTIACVKTYSIPSGVNELILKGFCASSSTIVGWYNSQVSINDEATAIVAKIVSAEQKDETKGDHLKEGSTSTWVYSRTFSVPTGATFVALYSYNNIETEYASAKYIKTT